MSSVYEILEKILLLQQSNSVVRLQWVPSHIGLRGNVQADLLAKQAAIDGYETVIAPYYLEVFNQYKNSIYMKWKEYFDERSKEKGTWYKAIACQPPRIPWCLNADLGRKIVVTAHRLRTGHIPLNKFKFLMKQVNSPNCDICGSIEDVHHILTECVKNRALREALITSANLNPYDVSTFIHILANPTSDAAQMVYRLADAILNN